MKLRARENVSPWGMRFAYSKVSPPSHASMIRDELASSILRAAERHLARISPWLRAAEYEIVGIEGRGLSHHCGFLADGEVAGPLWLYSMPSHDSIVLNVLSIVSNFAHDDHVVEHREQACLAEAGLLVLDVPFILIDGVSVNFRVPDVCEPGRVR